MKYSTPHTFHIPVMGLGFTIDTPVKVARFGISSVVSIIQDVLIEQMREHYCKLSGETYIAIDEKDIDFRAKRITAYLNLLQRIVDNQMEVLRKQEFGTGLDIDKYLRMLPDNAAEKKMYFEMLKSSGEVQHQLQSVLRKHLKAGKIDVNIMTKIDNPKYAKDGTLLPLEYSDAISAFRGFANSHLDSSVVFSAGLNPRLYAYIENYKDFFPDETGYIKKKIILKVSDYRSAIIQGKFLAKKGVWISEFRIESGLNCGGHAFPTEGYLMGPILEEFKNNKEVLQAELTEICNKALENKEAPLLAANSSFRITYQGGIGTANEDELLRVNYNIDGTGWGSPFLMVPEATNVDDHTLQQLVEAQAEDFYLSHASPLGIPFNNFRKSTGEHQRKTRIEKNRPGSPCYKKYLSFNTEFTDKPICVSSRQYQDLKIKELSKMDLPEKVYQQMVEELTEKDCLCEGLSSSVLLKNEIPDLHKLEAVTICPGPNLAYFSKVFSLEEMVGHIYGRLHVLNSRFRQHMFINELKMYVDYLNKEISKNMDSMTDKKAKYFASFRNNLLAGIEYYKSFIPKMAFESEAFKSRMSEEIDSIRNILTKSPVVQEV